MRGHRAVLLLATLAAVARAEHPLGLTDAEFWSAPTKTRAEVARRLATEDFTGLLIDAPSAVSVAERSTLPVVGWWVRSLGDDAKADPEREALVVAQEIGTDAVRAGRALDPGKHKAPAASGTRPDPGEGRVSSMFTIDARRALDLPWTAGRWRVVVLQGGVRSNAVDVDLRGPVGDAPTREPRAGARVDVAGPAPPELPGIVLEGGRGTRLGGSFRLAAGSPPPAVTLVATSRSHPGPFVVPLAVPASAAGDTTTGRFSLDLRSAAALPPGDATWYVYAFGGGAAAGPALLVPR